VKYLNTLRVLLFVKKGDILESPVKTWCLTPLRRLLDKESIMKKLVTFGAVVLIAMAFFGCSEQALEEPAFEYDEQGRRLVTFSVPTKAYTDATGGGVLGP
jgi:hypothetical protein